jgi:prefoldin subunit 5
MKKLILNSQDTAQIVVDYINASNQVCSYAMSIDTTQLPALVVPPANYGDFVQTFAQAKQDVMVWIDEVIPDLNLIPAAFIGYNALFQQQAGVIRQYLVQLKSSPGDPVILQDIKGALNTLINEAEACEQTIKGLDTAISTYQGNIAPDAASLNELCSQITAAENVDEQSIAQLNAVIANLQDIVNDRNKLITLNTLANITEGIFVAAVGVGVGVIFTGTAGVIVGIGFGIGSAILTTLEPVGRDIDYQETLEDIQTDMNNVNSEIGLINSTVGLLQNLNTQFAAIIAQSGAAETNIQIVLNFWQQLQNDAGQIITDLDDILDADSIDQAASDLTLALAAWDEIQSFMQSILGITYQIDSQVTMAPSVESMINA